MLNADDVDDTERIRTANSLIDYLQTYSLPSTVPITVTVSDAKAVAAQLSVESRDSEQLSLDDKAAMFRLLCRNMQHLYEQSGWGWNEIKKHKELFHRDSKFLVCRAVNAEIVGFVMFRFEWDDEDEPEHPVLFCYELQLQPEFRGKGVGRALMQLLLAIASRSQMWKTMLTCFKVNAAAMRFYQRIGFSVDSNSPSEHGYDEPYEILSDKPKLK